MWRTLQRTVKNHCLSLTTTVRLSSTEAQPLKLHAILTGPTGVGKTTLVQRVCSQLKERHRNIELRGFSIEEVRESYKWAGTNYPGPKIGFDVVTVNGDRGKLARVDVSGLRRFKFGKGPARKPKKNRFVGKYRVMTWSFEKTALPELEIPMLTQSPSQSEGVDVKSNRPVYIIDEIEKMGLFSKPFVNSVRSLMRQGPQPRPRKLKNMEPLIVMATFPTSTSGETHKLVNEIKAREDCVLFEVSEENRDSLVTEISNYLSQNLSE